MSSKPDTLTDSGTGYNLPPEIDDYVMNILTDDPETLKACSLTCRAWLAASRVYLFRDVTIETEDMFLRFEQVAIDSPMVQDCVRTLRIDRHTRKYELNFPWVNDRLSPVLPTQLKRLEKFEMVAVDEKWKTAAFKNLSLFTTVTRLSLVKCGFSTEELFGVISAFPSLKELYVADFNELFNGRDQPVQLVHKPKLERLTLHADSIPKRFRVKENLIDFLMNSCNASLRAVSLTLSKRNIEDFDNFIRALGPQLEELQLSFMGRFGWYETDLQSIYTHIDFSENTGLKTLTLSDPAHPATRTLLARIASPHIRTIRFMFRIYALRDIEKADPPSLTQALLAPNLSFLREVRFMYEVRGQVEGVDEALVKAYSRLGEKGILRMERKTSSG